MSGRGSGTRRCSKARLETELLQGGDVGFLSRAAQQQKAQRGVVPGKKAHEGGKAFRRPALGGAAVRGVDGDKALPLFESAAFQNFPCAAAFFLHKVDAGAFPLPA